MLRLNERLNDTKECISDLEDRIMEFTESEQHTERQINLLQRRQEYTMEKRQSLKQVVLGKLDSYMQINKIKTHPHTIYKSKFKMI